MHRSWISSLLISYVSAAVLPRDDYSDFTIKEEKRCPQNLKNLVFNYGFDVAQYDMIDAGDHWVSNYHYHVVNNRDR